MKTDYQNINKFEMAVVAMIVAGFIILGITLFSSLTPRQQVNVASAFQMLDLHQEVSKTISSVTTAAEIIWDGQEEFYNQFYIAFAEVATIPDDAPLIEIGKEMHRNVAVAFKNLSSQITEGYAASVETQNTNSQLAQLPYDGKVMGAMIDLSDKISSIKVFDESFEKTLNLHYEYEPPKLESLNIVLKTFKTN